LGEGHRLVDEYVVDVVAAFAFDAQVVV
jgi:hypothetical protein